MTIRDGLIVSDVDNSLDQRGPENIKGGDDENVKTSSLDGEESEKVWE